MRGRRRSCCFASEWTHPGPTARLDMALLKDRLSVLVNNKNKKIWINYLKASRISCEMHRHKAENWANGKQDIKSNVVLRTSDNHVDKMHCSRLNYPALYKVVKVHTALYNREMQCAHQHNSNPKTSCVIVKHWRGTFYCTLRTFNFCTFSGFCCKYFWTQDFYFQSVVLVLSVSD